MISNNTKKINEKVYCKRNNNDKNHDDENEKKISNNSFFFMKNKKQINLSKSVKRENGETENTFSPISSTEIKLKISLLQFIRKMCEITGKFGGFLQNCVSVCVWHLFPLLSALEVRKRRRRRKRRQRRRRKEEREGGGGEEEEKEEKEKARKKKKE